MDQFPRSCEILKKWQIGKFFRLAGPQNWLFKGFSLKVGSIASRGGRVRWGWRRDFKEVLQIARRSRGKRHSFRVFRTWDAIVKLLIPVSYRYIPTTSIPLSHTNVYPYGKDADGVRIIHHVPKTGSASCMNLPILRNDLNKYRSYRPTQKRDGTQTTIHCAVLPLN